MSSPIHPCDVCWWEWFCWQCAYDEDDPEDEDFDEDGWAVDSLGRWYERGEQPEEDSDD